MDIRRKRLYDILTLFIIATIICFYTTSQSRLSIQLKFTEDDVDDRPKAAIMALCRNKELEAMAKTMQQLEDRFNKKFKYDWVFLNNEQFSPDFINTTSAIASGRVKHVLIPMKYWSYPWWIDQDKAANTREEMKAQKIIYGGSESYRHMCRFKSGFFFELDEMAEYDYYWLVEPNTQFFCDVDYDVFQYMKDNNKLFGFSLVAGEIRKTIRTFWKSTKEFLDEHPEYIAENNLSEFITNNKRSSFNGNHFWSNLEIGSLKFFRSEAYREYFKHMDQAGGFFYERWGDGPLHAVAATHFIPKDQIHFFDIGYRHGILQTCPLDEEYRSEHNCACNPGKDFRYRDSVIGRMAKKFYDLMELPKPEQYPLFAQGDPTKPKVTKTAATALVAPPSDAPPSDVPLSKAA
ncbi:KRE2 [[Candida] subhashii]|uniref:KRE2 n=1 Tax=[Candida] subhashii TaxID=561895 RepID=A0A8J5UU84_9ASCO|nr:KRE2 [[Candida] subhashii]KAG7660529.1 KRE2 [[Candida] subhashii]